MRLAPQVALLGGLASTASACSMAPEYSKPVVPVASDFEAEGPWRAARPADQLPVEAWWSLYEDAVLSDLQDRLLDHNATLEAAFHSYLRSDAYLDRAESGFYPEITAEADGYRNKQSENRALRGPNVPTYYTDLQLGARLSYELDLWGRVRDTVNAEAAEAEASLADLGAVRLNLTARLTQTYVRLRGYDLRIELLERSVGAYEKALDLTQARKDGGISSGLDVSRAKTQLSVTRARLARMQSERALLENAIAELVGDSAIGFRVEPKVELPVLPTIPMGLPSELLERRPDIAAAERRTRAANARVGVARTAFFPQITLGLAGGFESQDITNLFSLPSLFWSIGTTLVQTVFDGGKRKAEVDAAEALLAEQGARYRGVVLAAFREVEDSVALLEWLGDAQDAQSEAAASAAETLDLSTSRYREGAVSYLDVVIAQTSALETEMTRLAIQTQRLEASVQLIRALGGGWSASTDDPEAIADGDVQPSPAEG